MIGITFFSWCSFIVDLVVSFNRSLVFRDVCVAESCCKISRRHHQMASHGTVYDMALDPAMEFVVTVGQVTNIKSFQNRSELFYDEWVAELPVSTTGLSAPNQIAPHVFTLCKQSIC